MTAGELHTAAGAFGVALQIAAVIEFAEPSTYLATALLGSLSALATCAQLRLARALGRYCDPSTRYLLPMSTNGKLPATLD